MWVQLMYVDMWVAYANATILTQAVLQPAHCSPN